METVGVPLKMESESGEIDYSTIFEHTLSGSEDISWRDASKPGQNLNVLVEDTMYFYAEDATYGAELWAHNFSNSTTWQVADIRSGYGSSNQVAVASAR